MECNKCGEKPGVPFIVVEELETRHDRRERRLLIALVLVVVMMFASNLAWLYYYSQYEYVEESTVTVDGKDGNANYIGQNGDIHNGENSSDKKTN